MKLRTLILFGAGIITGLAIARKMREDDPQVLHGPTRSSESASPAVRAVTSQAQRVAESRHRASLAAIKRARVAITSASPKSRTTTSTGTERYQPPCHDREPLLAA